MKFNDLKLAAGCWAYHKILVIGKTSAVEPAHSTYAFWEG